METARIFVGYDPREAVAYHVFCESVIRNSSIPVAFYPLHRTLIEGFDGQRDGSNAFIYSRYLVPYVCDFNGWAIFADGDMVVNGNIAELWEARKEFAFDKAVAVVKHDYRTKNRRKYIGSKLENLNVDYPRKNWSSVMLWNCAHYSNRTLNPEYVGSAKPNEIHRFSWLKDDQIGELPVGWNHLVGEDPPGAASLYHFTLGEPGIKHYADDYESWRFHAHLLGALECAGEKASEMVKRAEDRQGAI